MSLNKTLLHLADLVQFAYESGFQGYNPMAEVAKELARLTEKIRSQKLELRRLNAAHLLKNARIENLEKEVFEITSNEQKLKDSEEALIATVRAFLTGEIEVVRPFQQVPMPAQGAPDLMSLVKDIHKETQPDDDIPF